MSSSGRAAREGCAASLSNDLPGRHSLTGSAMRKHSGLLVPALFGVLVLAWCGCTLWLGAQQTERPGNSRDDPAATPHDLSGLSLKNPRVRVVHTTKPS